MQAKADDSFTALRNENQGMNGLLVEIAKLIGLEGQDVNPQALFAGVQALVPQPQPQG